MLSDERIEVAKRLRGLDVEITSHDTLEIAVDKFIKAVCGDIPFSPIRYSVRNICGLANMLADLIDPTCHVREYGHHDELRVVGCSVCRFGWLEDVHCIPDRFCPHCGARLVERG